MSHFWTTKEVAILREHYPRGGGVACLDLLPDREIQAIYRKAATLGLRYSGMRNSRMSIHCRPCRPDDPWPTYTEAYRRTCLARFVAELPTREERRALINGLSKRHGQPSAERLKGEVRREFEERRRDLKAPERDGSDPARTYQQPANREPRA